ncbi:MAG: hypothetical protein K0U66_00135, partial [Gammaproteobacteria bacterium]|nr:hypothetical protein [Gammaproteobacteria bacterium]
NASPSPPTPTPCAKATRLANADALGQSGCLTSFALCQNRASRLASDRLSVVLMLGCLSC